MGRKRGWGGWGWVKLVEKGCVCVCVLGCYDCCEQICVRCLPLPKCRHGCFQYGGTVQCCTAGGGVLGLIVGRILDPDVGPLWLRGSSQPTWRASPRGRERGEEKQPRKKKEQKKRKPKTSDRPADRPYLTTYCTYTYSTPTR